MSTSRNWAAWNRHGRHMSSSRPSSYDLSALCRRNGTSHKPRKHSKKAGPTVVRFGEQRKLNADERQQLRLQMELAEQTGDLARYVNAKAALACGK